MTDYSGKSNEEMASEFIVRTCQLLPKSVSLASDYMHDLNLTVRPVPRAYSILCGSQAEFFIRPLNTCITDRDFLTCNTDELIFSGDFSVFPFDKTALSDNFTCVGIEPYLRYPGFVRLRMMGEMIYNWKFKSYELIHTAATDTYVVPDMETLNTPHKFLGRLPQLFGESKLPSVISGPAIKSLAEYDFSFECDSVNSLYAPQWPREARNWPIRPRKYGWPTMNTISEVVQNGCHVVYVQHRFSRAEKEQWRLSFSFAEITLLQSWTKIQQIIYHLLRFFAKRELIQKDCPKEDEVLCPYHLKTLMLWTCEEMPPEWWNSSSVIAICCELLKRLSEWVKKRYCPNYFIPEAKLFYEPSSSALLDKTERRLKEFQTPDILCQWFVETYILPITRTQFTFLNTRKVVPDFIDYMLPLLEYRKANELDSLDFLLTCRLTDCNKMCRGFIKCGLSSGLRLSLNFGQFSVNVNLKLHSIWQYLSTTEKVLCFRYYDILLWILHVAYGLGCGEISWDSRLFVELVQAISMQPNIIRSTYHNFPRMCSAQCSRFQFLRAQDLMKNLTGSNSRSEFQLLSLMSKEFLMKALEYDGSKSNGIASAVLAYLAALHFATSEYQQTLTFCLSALVDHSAQKDKETLNAGCLLFIDDVARIVGLCVLHKKITDNNLNCIGRRLYLDLRFSTEVFAYYLAELSAKRMSRYIELHHVLPDSAFPMDEYLTALLKPKFIVSMKLGTHLNANRQIIYRRTDSLTEMEVADVNPLKIEETVIDILMESALENMTSLYGVISEDFDIQCNTVDCYRALYLYKCRQYDESLGLCKRILQEPDLRSDLKEFSLANVLLLPPFDSYFDRDMQSLLGLHTLFYYLSPLNDVRQTFELTPESTFAQWFVDSVCSYRNVISFLLHCQYNIRCNYFLGRHFLARYLKLRCCVDCNLPYKEAMIEFTYHKTNLPFEHIIRKFMLQKLRVVKKVT